MNYISLRGLRVGGAATSLRFWRDGQQTRWEPIRVDGQLEIKQQPWQPWTVAEPEPIRGDEAAGHESGTER